MNQKKKSPASRLSQAKGAAPFKGKPVKGKKEASPASSKAVLLTQENTAEDMVDDAADDASDRYHVPNLLRALRIMEFLAANREGQTQADLARMLSLPKNSVLRITQTLADEGYLVRDGETKAYRLSRKLLALGFAAIGEEGLLEQSLDIMRDLRNVTREPTMIAILLEHEGVVLDSVPGLEPVRLVVEQGTHFPLHSAAPGKAMLAFLPEKEQVDLCQRLPFTRYTATTITSRDVFLKELKKVRQQGYAFDRGEEIEGVVCVAAPILDHHDRPIAAIWVTGPTFRLPETRLEEMGLLVAEHAARISARFGHQVL